MSRYELLIEEHPGYSRFGGAESLADLVDAREACAVRTIIVERLDPIKVYAEVARGTTAPVYPSPSAAWEKGTGMAAELAMPLPPLSAAERELAKFEASEVKG